MKITVHNLLTTQLIVGGLDTVAPNATESFVVKASVFENVIDGLLELEAAGSITLTVGEDPDSEPDAEIATIAEITTATTVANGLLRSGLDGRVLAARCASTAQRALTGLTALDGVTPVAGEIVLMKDQDDPIENGLYVAAAGAWARLTNIDGGDVLAPASIIVVTEGTAGAMTLWSVDELSVDEGVDAIRFVPLQEAALAADLLLATTGNGAALVGVEDVAGRFLAEDVEAALAACATDAELASVAPLDGAFIVGVHDTADRFLGNNIEQCLGEVLVAGDLGKVTVVTGVEGAISANAFDIECTLEDVFGVDFSAATEVQIRSFAVTAGQGDLAAAGTPVGTVVKTNNPATGCNEMWMTSTAAGLFSFRCTDTAAEDCLVEILAEGCKPKLFKLTFA